MEITAERVMGQPGFTKKYAPVIMLALALAHRKSVVDIYTQHTAEVYCWLVLAADAVAAAMRKTKLERKYKEINEHFANTPKPESGHTQESVFECIPFMGLCVEQSVALYAEQTQQSANTVAAKLLKNEPETMSFVCENICKLAQKFANQLNAK